MKHLKIVFFLLTVSLFGFLKSFGQTDIADTTIHVPMFFFSYSYQVPGGDLADRFGNNSSAGGGFQWKTNTNWIFGVELNYIFGTEIKIEDELMGNLRTGSGQIIDQAGNFGIVNNYERGYFASFKFGKVIPVLSPNPNSGILLTGSIGYLQHKIRIEVTDNNIPQLQDDYKRGYDRLAGGITLSQFVGYIFFSNSKLANFYGGFEFTEAFAKPKRKVNFDTLLPDPVSKRFDLFMGIRLGWMIPLMRRMPEKVYYY
ncbi:MAG: hypothetical protein GXO89_15785 [Chlorobi bacterium]|nr:hypothetical protein [Chlorobiota bacterium]